MTRRRRPPELHTEHTFQPEPLKRKKRRILLFNPPVYDAQYWARWSQPAGLLRIATLLREYKYDLDLIDCMESDARGHVKKTWRRDADNRQMMVHRDDMVRRIWHFGLEWNSVRQRLAALPEPPDEVWITSMMTYWWESTRDAVDIIREMFPKARILVGGLYPTLAPEHALKHVKADIIFKGELTAASNLWTDLSLYQHPPSYAILTTSRGCPWDCHYCAARALNNDSNKMRKREPEDVLAEIEHKMHTYNIRQFGFYEDNALALRGHLQRVLELIIERQHKLRLYAPEGFETRLLTVDLLRLMKQAGFEKVHLPFEALKWETNLGWNRRHASTASFERALDAAITAGFKPRTQEINAFVLFGLPDDKFEDILDSVVYVHHMVGSIIPMLFTPVPGTHIYAQYKDYLHNERGWDLQDLNGKFLPFLELNQQRYPGLHASDYLRLEALMSVLNDGKFLSRAVDLCDDSVASQAFRDVVQSTVASRLNGTRKNVQGQPLIPLEVV
jgi:radical SAM superfamily enzyme YgiQ (UPF0313 family)